jgi:hypothetical protein
MAVMWRSTSEIEVREYNGRPANMMWFHIGENKFSLLYNHATAFFNNLSNQTIRILAVYLFYRK